MSNLVQLIDRLPLTVESLSSSKLGKVIRKLVKDEPSSGESNVSILPAGPDGIHFAAVLSCDKTPELYMQLLVRRRTCYSNRASLRRLLDHDPFFYYTKKEREKKNTSHPHPLFVTDTQRYHHHHQFFSETRKIINVSNYFLHHSICFFRII